jgi:hypothetical protein
MEPENELSTDKGAPAASRSVQRVRPRHWPKAGVEVAAGLINMKGDSMLARRMIAIAILLLALEGMVLFPLSASPRNQQVKHTDRNEEWVRPTFHGIRVGESTTGDVLRTFGKPKWKGGVQDLVVPSDKQGEIQYEYSAVPDIDGDITIYFGKRTGVVSAILVYPKQMTRADVITKFGSEFEESNEKLGPCPTARERKVVAGYHVEYGALLVYRKLGVYVDIKKDGTAFLVAYVRSCR